MADFKNGYVPWYFFLFQCFLESQFYLVQSRIYGVFLDPFSSSRVNLIAYLNTVGVFFLYRFNGKRYIGTQPIFHFLGRSRKLGMAREWDDGPLHEIVQTGFRLRLREDLLNI